jgi:lipopolysaccharide export system permease protein
VLTVIDRYLALMFCKIFLICWVSLTGLFIMVDAFSNLEEFLELAKHTGNLGGVLSEYYGPRVFDFFDRTAPLLALVASIGALVWMQRTNELVAIEAAGISKSRLLRPLTLCTAILVVACTLDRELLIPRFKLALARNAQSWDGSEARPINPLQDQQSGVWIVGGKITLAQRRIDHPELQLPPQAEAWGRRILAETADAVDPNPRHPRGLILKNVAEPASLSGRASFFLDQTPLILTPQDAPWLNQDEIFVACGIALEELAFGQEIQRYASLAEQLAGLRNPSMWFSNRHRVQVHGRILRPFLDFAILLIGIPVVLTRRERNIFLAFGVCLFVVIAVQLFVVACHHLGASRILTPASFAAWLPLLVLAPTSVVALKRLDL